MDQSRSAKKKKKIYKRTMPRERPNMISILARSSSELLPGARADVNVSTLAVGVLVQRQLTFLHLKQPRRKALSEQGRCRARRQAAEDFARCELFKDEAYRTHPVAWRSFEQGARAAVPLDELRGQLQKLLPTLIATERL